MINKSYIKAPKRFFNMLKVDKHDVFSIYVYALFNGILTLSIPLGIQAIISFLTAGEISTSWIILVVFVVLGIGLSGVMQIMQLRITENLQQKIFTRSAFEFAYRIPRMKAESLDDKYPPEIANRFFDTLSVQKGLSKIIIDFSTASLQVLFGLILLSLYHPFFILFSITLLLIVYLIFKFTAPKGLKSSLKESTNKYEVAYWLEEIARTTSTFKLAGETDLPLKKIDRKVSEYLTSRKAHFKTLLIQYINLVGFKLFIAAGLLIIGGGLVINGQMNIGQFVASEIIIILVLASIEKLILSMETIYDVLTSIEKIGLVTDIPLEDENGTKLYPEDGGLSIKTNKLYYKFENEESPVIKNISFELKKSEKLCVSGFAGSGKSFLLQTLAGLYENYEGTILVNDNSLKTYFKKSLRNYIGDNLSKEDIFRGTIQENISLGKEQITIEQIKHAAKIVGLSSFLDPLAKGLQTELFSEGRNLPKSIRLKIILARAIVGKPKLLLLENNYSQLPETDRINFLNYILDEKNDCTVILISNDKKVAERFDKVLVLEKGTSLAFDHIKKLNSEIWFNDIFE